MILDPLSIGIGIALVSAVGVAIKKVRQMSATIDSVTQEVDRSKTEITLQEQRASILEKRATSTAENLQELQARYAQLEEKALATELEVEKQSEQIKDAELTIQSKQKSIEAAEKNIRACQREVEVLLVKERAEKVRANNAESTIKELQARAEATRATLNERDAKIKKLSAQINTLEKNIRECREQIEEGKKESKTISQRSAELQKELEVLRQRFSELHEQHEQEKVKNQEAFAALGELRQESECLQQKNQLLMRALSGDPQVSKKLSRLIGASDAQVATNPSAIFTPSNKAATGASTPSLHHESMSYQR